MTARALVLAIVVLAAVPATAAAKGVDKLKVCGPERCLSPLVDAGLAPVFFERVPARAPARPAPHYLMTWEQFVENSVEVVPMRARYVPSAGLLRMEDGTWERPDARATAALRTAMRGVKPFAVRKPRRVQQAQAGGGVPAAAIGGAAVLLLGGALLVAGRRRRAAG